MLVGGVGGAKLALGLQQVVAPENLTIIVNTGDDFWHYGLKICPDIEAVLSDIKNSAISATSCGFKYFFNGCLSIIFSFILSLRNSLSAKPVLVTVGAIAFTLTVGANSAANDFMSPSTPPLAAAILA